MKSSLHDFPKASVEETKWPWIRQGNDIIYDVYTDIPKITIITPSYNQGPFIERTIRSILLQGYPNLEYIIIDGGSTDNTIEIIKKYERYITYWVSEKDNGTYDANNKGLKKATGDYWCIVNSDDILLPDALNAMLALIQKNPNEKWISGSVYHIDENDNIIAEQIPQKPETIEGYTFFYGCWISHPGVFLHRSIISTVGEFAKYHLMDLQYWLRLEKAGFQPFITCQFLAALRIHSDCKSADVIKLKREMLKVLSDFSGENDLSDKPDVVKAFKNNNIILYNILLLDSLALRKRGNAIKILIKILRIKVSMGFQRWYWGAVLRLFFISKDDPIYENYPLNITNGNWND